MPWGVRRTLGIMPLSSRIPKDAAHLESTQLRLPGVKYFHGKVGSAKMENDLVEKNSSEVVLSPVSSGPTSTVAGKVSAPKTKRATLRHHAGPYDTPKLVLTTRQNGRAVWADSLGCKKSIGARKNCCLGAKVKRVRS